MGMSATQARFLSLTARKSNVEFEGQQINQQRTTLSNESASYYSELCNMEVPTPPSVDDYTKVSYTFNDGAMTNTVTSLIARGSGEYSVSYLQQWQDDYSITPASSALIARSKRLDGTVVYSVGTSKLRSLGEEPRLKDDVVKVFLPDGDSGSGVYAYYKEPVVIKEHLKSGPGGVPIQDENGNFIVIRVDVYEANDDGTLKKDEEGQDILALQVSNPFGDDYYNSLDEKQRADLLEEERYYIKMLQDKYGADTTWAVRYVKNSTTGSYEPYFYKIEDLNNNEKYTANDLANIDCYSLGSSTQTKEVLNQKAVVEKDSSGRYIGITLFDKEGNQTSYSLTTTTTTDEEAYNDAMNQYHYAQHEYDHKIQEINSKLEVIQQQDKNLELKLKQLDTEENAISTELDAVKKVISKNVDSSFKTFNA